jgi:hypothetical protein
LFQVSTVHKEIHITFEPPIVGGPWKLVAQLLRNNRGYTISSRKIEMAQMTMLDRTRATYGVIVDDIACPIDDTDIFSSAEDAERAYLEYVERTYATVNDSEA